MKQLHVVKKSFNRKTGEVGATYRPVGPTCPSDCALLDNGCYAQRGFTNFQQMNAAEYTDEFDKLADCEFVRHQVSGDAFHDDELDVKYAKAMIGFHYDHEQVEGWTYTHRHQDWDDAGLGPEVHPNNLAILASVDSIKEAKRAWKAGWNTARVTTDPKDKRDEEVLCPYDLAKHQNPGKQPAVQCVSCKKCWQGKNILFVKL